MTATYTPLATVTASGLGLTQLIMSSIPSTYTDLILIGNIGTTFVGVNGYLQFNGDTAGNYSWTRLLGEAAASSQRGTNTVGINYLTNSYNAIVCHIQNYSNSTTYKTAMVRASNPSNYVSAVVGTWRNTAAINSITVDMDSNFIPAGSTFTLYGIEAA